MKIKTIPLVLGISAFAAKASAVSLEQALHPSMNSIEAEDSWLLRHPRQRDAKREKMEYAVLQREQEYFDSMALVFRRKEKKKEAKYGMKVGSSYLPSI